MTTPYLRLVPKDQVPNDDFILVGFACDVRPDFCHDCAMAQCPFGWAPGLAPEPEDEGPDGVA